MPFITHVNKGDATCKRLVKYASSIALMPLNTKYEPMIFTNEEIISQSVRVIGKVVELRGKFKSIEKRGYTMEQTNKNY